LNQRTDKNASWLQLEGSRALITGATRNTGRAIAEGFADAGADVAVLGGSDGVALEETLASLRERGTRASGRLQPLDDAEGVIRTANELLDEFGGIDVLVNVAAIRPLGELDEITIEDWDRVLAVNLRAPFFLAQAVIPGMRERQYGRIINFSGMNAYWGRKARTHVVTSKGGMVALSRALASSTAKQGITVNTVVPGTIDTTRQNPGWYPNPEERRARQLERVPMGRLGEVEDVVSLVLFLASPRAGYSTGQEFFVSGGGFPLVQE
jgi:3-oxoacyl-[acyl-carrier protein] reductase